MAYLGRQGVTAPLTSADIPDNSITTAKIVDDNVTAAKIPAGAVSSDVLYLENATAAQELSGTFATDTERLYFNDLYTLTGNLTIEENAHLALGTITDKDVLIEADTGSTERTITGEGTLESGRLMNDPTTSLTGMTGELGSGVTFPAGHILQVQSNHQADSGSTTNTNTVNKALVSVSITPSSTSSKILILATGVSGHYAGGAYMNRGELFKDGTTSLHGTFLLISARETNANSTTAYGMNFLDSPATTSPILYSLNGASATGAQANFYQSSITVMEVVA